MCRRLESDKSKLIFKKVEIKTGTRDSCERIEGEGSRKELEVVKNEFPMSDRVLYLVENEGLVVALGGKGEEELALVIGVEVRRGRW